MAVYKGNTIANGATCHLDGSTFIDCTYIGSILIYSGGELPVLKNNVFKNCQIKYSGSPEKKDEFISFLNGSGQFDSCNMSW